MRTTFKGALYLSTAASIWGGMYVVSKYVLNVIPPFTLLFFRYLLASLFLVGWCRWRGIGVIPKKDKWDLFQIGFFGYFLSIAAQFIGTKLSSAHLGAVITTLSPVFQSGFAVWILKERISLKQVCAIGISTLGVLVLTDVFFLKQLDAFNTGNLFFLAAACLWGYYSVLSKKVASGHSALQITTWGILWATLWTLPFAIKEINTWDVNILGDFSVLLSLLYLSVISTTVAFFCWNRGLSLTNPHFSGVFFFFQSIVGSVLGYLVLGEVLTSAFLWGSVLIIIGVFLVMQTPGETVLNKKLS